MLQSGELVYSSSPYHSDEGHHRSKRREEVVTPHLIEYTMYNITMLIFRKYTLYIARNAVNVTCAHILNFSIKSK